MNVPTLAVVSGDGKIIAGKIYPNVVLGIGGYKRKNVKYKKWAEFILKGEIMEV